MMSLKSKAADTAKRAGLMSGGLLFCMIGMGFLTVAGWFFLTTLYSALAAASMLAAVYFGIGLIMIGVSRTKNQHSAGLADQAAHASSNSDANAGLPPLVQAFFVGMQAGSQASKRT